VLTHVPLVNMSPITVLPGMAIILDPSVKRFHAVDCPQVFSKEQLAKLKGPLTEARRKVLRPYTDASAKGSYAFVFALAEPDFDMRRMGPLLDRLNVDFEDTLSHPDIADDAKAAYERICSTYPMVVLALPSLVHGNLSAMTSYNSL
jgi:hypothetical protein